jgi:hypothetical protein
MSAREPTNAAEPSARAVAEEAGIDPLRARHLALSRRQIRGPAGVAGVTVDEAESPLAWLARRKGRDGRALIEPVQLLAGERLRAEFTRAGLMPRITANWSASVADGRRGASSAPFTESVIAARQCVRHALEAVGPEFAGLLVDVCCFLKGLVDIERERNWPQRSARWCCSSVSIGWRGATVCAPNRAAAARQAAHLAADDVEFVVGVGDDV